MYNIFVLFTYVTTKLYRSLLLHVCYRVEVIKKSHEKSSTAGTVKLR